MPATILHSKNNYTGTAPIIAKAFHTVKAIQCLLANFEYTSQTITIVTSPLTDDELTRLCMSISEKSLSESWDKEDDERWNKFLNTSE